MPCIDCGIERCADTNRTFTTSRPRCLKCWDKYNAQEFEKIRKNWERHGYTWNGTQWVKPDEEKPVNDQAVRDTPKEKECADCLKVQEETKMADFITWECAKCKQLRRLRQFARDMGELSSSKYR
jgi:hypothetical protein